MKINRRVNEAKEKLERQTAFPRPSQVSYNVFSVLIANTRNYRERKHASILHVPSAIRYQATTKNNERHDVESHAVSDSFSLSLSLSLSLADKRLHRSCKSALTGFLARVCSASSLSLTLHPIIAARHGSRVRPWKRRMRVRRAFPPPPPRMRAHAWQSHKAGIAAKKSCL